MKNKLFILFVCIAAMISAHAQTDSETLNQFIAKCKPLNDTYNDAYRRKDYPRTIQTLQTMLQAFNRLQLTKADHEKYGEDLRAEKTNIYYNMACCYALQNKKKKAIEAFQKAIANGYTNYRHALKDTDLSAIHNDKLFKQALATIEQFDNLYILRHAKPYCKEATDSFPRFTYQQSDNNSLKQIRTYFNLDSIAGNGDEVSKILNLLRFVHNTILHDMSPVCPKTIKTKTVMLSTAFTLRNWVNGFG